MKETEFNGYYITERKMNNGWYELSTLVYSAGEEYRDSRVYDHQPSETDYAAFVRKVESNR